MSVSYVKKAKGTVRAQCEFDSKLLKQGDVVIPLDIRNKENDTVFTAKITFHIIKKKT